jgi:predicted nucleotidyltransferase
MILHDLEKKKLIHPPKWLATNTVLLMQMGSVAYGCSTDLSDIDIYGICLPPLTEIFPHLAGEIEGFGTQKQKFAQFQEHHVKDGELEYDFSIYNIVKFFQIAMNGNPNITDSLFVPRRCIVFSTDIGEMIRENRKLFLSKVVHYRYRGYAMKQMHKIRNKVESSNPKRAADIAAHGYDTKYAMHLVRLGLFAEQMMTTGNLDMEIHADILKSIRRGEWKFEDIEKWFAEKEASLEELYKTSDALPHSPDEQKIKDVLLKALEHHYGSLAHAIKATGSDERILSDLKALVEKYS